MSYSKANILTLAGNLCHDLDTSSTISTFFDDVIIELGFLENPVFYAQDFVEITAGTATYSFPSGALKILHAFYGDRMLLESSEEELDAYSKTYRSDSGDPRAISYDLLSNKFRLMPVPDASSTGGGNNLDDSFTSDWVWCLFAEERASAFTETYAISIALLALQKEFSYESKHQDIPFAENCEALAKLILNLLGHKYDD